MANDTTVPRPPASFFGTGAPQDAVRDPVVGDGFFDNNSGALFMWDGITWVELVFGAETLSMTEYEAYCHKEERKKPDTAPAKARPKNPYTRKL